MRKILYFILVSLVLVACRNGVTGELVGVQPRPTFTPRTPLGMVFIPSGSFNMGQSDQEVPFAHTMRSKTVSVFAFYMDDTEISNNEYRQFVYYVRDSLVRRVLGEEDPDAWLLPVVDDQGDALDPTEWNIDWSRRLRYWDPNIVPLLSQMYLPEHERYYKRKQIDTRKLLFEYYWIDYMEAARKGRINVVRNGFDKEGTKLSDDHRTLKNEPHPFTENPVGRDYDLGQFNEKGQNNAIRGHEDRSRFIIKEVINVFPDTLCWVHDFTYSFNDPMTNMYFWHPAYDNYPVVGITWQQAQAFCVWRTQLYNNWLASIGELYVQDYRLPTEAEWEYAARGDLDLSPYPWGGPYIRNARGCFLGNFKPMRGRYLEDGGFYTVTVNSYYPNEFGLFNMAGNVAEWTNSSYEESAYEIYHDLNPEYRYHAYDWDPPAMKRKVIRGGSWKDIGYFLQTGTRTYEYQDTAKSYVGFRCVMSYIGRGAPTTAKDLK